MRPAFRPCLALGASLLAASGGHAAEASKPAEAADAPLIQENVLWPRGLHDALGLPEWLDLGLEQRTRFETLDGPFRGGEADSQTQYVQRTRLRLGLDAPAGFRFLAEVQDARTWGDGPNDFTTNEIDKVSFLQLFGSYTRRELFGTNLRGDVHAGRMTLDLGSRRLVARNGFRNTTNAFDGVHVSLGEPGVWRTRAFYVRPVIIDPSYFEDESEGQRRFWGAAVEDKRIPWLNAELYYLGLHDGIATSQALARRYDTIGGRVLRAPKPGFWDYEVELMGQFGDRTISRGGERTELDQAAYGGHAELGYGFAAPWSPRLVGLLDYASGTADPNGDDSNTFDPLFGARRGDFMPTGSYGPFTRSNLWGPGLRLHVSPRPDLKGFVKVRYWRLAQARDAYVGTGLRDPSGDAGTELGWDLELMAQWTPRPWLTLEAGYDHWWKGSYLDDVPPPAAGPISTKDSDYFYLSVMFRI